MKLIEQQSRLVESTIDSILFYINLNQFTIHFKLRKQAMSFSPVPQNQLQLDLYKSNQNLRKKISTRYDSSKSSVIEKELVLIVADPDDLNDKIYEEYKSIEFNQPKSGDEDMKKSNKQIP